MMRQPQSSFNSPFFRTLICLIFVYMLGHLSTFLPASTNSFFTSISVQSIAYADEDEDEDDDEDEDEDEEGGEEESEGEEGEEEEDLSYLTD
ncbi:MAG: hypothetical protein HOE32_04160, partial [Nitrospina sp.]|nr:hypothetical protein [Nitrospina sp.]